MRLNRSSNTLEQVGGVRYTIKNGVIYDAPMMLEQVRTMVATAKADDGS